LRISVNRLSASPGGRAINPIARKAYDRVQPGREIARVRIIHAALLDPDGIFGPDVPSHYPWAMRFIRMILVSIHGAIGRVFDAKVEVEGNVITIHS